MLNSISYADLIADTTAPDESPDHLVILSCIRHRCGWRGKVTRNRIKYAEGPPCPRCRSLTVVHGVTERRRPDGLVYKKAESAIATERKKG